MSATDNISRLIDTYRALCSRVVECPSVVVSSELTNARTGEYSYRVEVKIGEHILIDNLGKTADSAAGEILAALAKLGFVLAEEITS